jgi:hypothetical protein
MMSEVGPSLEKLIAIMIESDKSLFISYILLYLHYYIYFKYLFACDSCDSGIYEKRT